MIEQPHAGEAVARNTGVAGTTAEWVCFLDDDDLWHPDHLSRTAEYLAAHPGCRALTSSFWTFAAEPADCAELEAGDLAGCLCAAERPMAEPNDMSYLDINGRSFELLLERNRGSISGATVHRDTLLAAGCFPVGYTCGADSGHVHQCRPVHRVAPFGQPAFVRPDPSRQQHPGQPDQWTCDHPGLEGRLG